MGAPCSARCAGKPPEAEFSDIPASIRAMRRAALLCLVVAMTSPGCGGGAAPKPSTPKKAEKSEPKTAESKALAPQPAQLQGELAAKAVGTPAGELAEPDSETAAPPTENLDEMKVAEDGKAYGQVLIKTTSTEDHVAELTIVRDDGVKARSGAVRFTAEPRVVVASPKTTLDEANLLGTGIAVDIDGDGKTSAKIGSKCESGTAVLKTKPEIRLEPVTSLTDEVARFDYGESDARILANDGAGALLYAPCDSGNVVLGLDPSAPLKLHTVPSPAAFVVYRVEVDAADAEDPFSLTKIDTGDKPVEHQLFPFREFSVEGDTVKVYAAHLVVFALDQAQPLQHVSIHIAGEKPEFITASINEVDADGKRIRYADGFRKFQ